MTQEKDINYWKNNCEENYITTPISVLRYISELEKLVTPHQQETHLKQIDQTNPVTRGSTALVQEISDEEIGKEPKQENCCTPIGQIKRYVDCIGCDRKPKQETVSFEPFDKEKASSITKEGQKLVRELQRVMEQETLEEAAKKYATNHGMMSYVFPEKEKSFIDGAKWQQEQDKWKRVYDEIPPSYIELLVKSPTGVIHLSSWREAYNIFSCQEKSESSLDWEWKII
jgi:hypothetical protein